MGLPQQTVEDVVETSYSHVLLTYGDETVKRHLATEIENTKGFPLDSSRGKKQAKKICCYYYSFRGLSSRAVVLCW